jgi:DNA-binding transcriptional MocR family regulator
MIKGQVLNINRGQQARSELTLSKEWKWSRNKVRRFLETLKKQGMIESETGHLTSIITICNYSSFQSDDTAGDTTHETPSGTPDGHLTGHSKEGKKEKNVKKTTSRFAPPSQIEVENYFREKGSSLPNQQAVKFMSHYQSNGWKVGKNKMKCWKSAVSGWVGRDNEKAKTTASNQIPTYQEQFLQEKF